MRAPDHFATGSFVTDIIARAAAIASGAAFWWLWLTVDIAVVLGIAGATRKLDVSPSVVVAALALLTIVFLIAGLFAIQPIFEGAYKAATATLTLIGRHRRAITGGIARISISLLKLSLIVVGVVAGIGAYVQALMWGMALTVMTADQLGSVPTELGPDAIPVWVATFARMYVAIGLFAICIAVIYLPAKRGVPRLGPARG